MQKLIITAAICGAEVFKDQTKYIPYTADELAKESKKCVDAGASIIHLHVRDKDGNPTQDIVYFEKAIKAIKKKCSGNPIIQPSTGGSISMDLEERIQPLSLKPEMATLDCGTMNFYDDIFVNDMAMMREFAKKMQEYNIKPEFEVFDTAGIEQSKILMKEGLADGLLHYNIVLGVQGGMAATPKNLIFMTELLPQNSTWTVSAVGRYQIPMSTVSIAMDGYCRVGLEDNIYYSESRLAKGSYELVKKVKRISLELGRKIASPDETREMLGIK